MTKRFWNTPASFLDLRRNQQFLDIKRKLAPIRRHPSQEKGHRQAGCLEIEGWLRKPYPRFLKIIRKTFHVHMKIKRTSPKWQTFCTILNTTALLKKKYFPQMTSTSDGSLILQHRSCSKTRQNKKCKQCKSGQSHHRYTNVSNWITFAFVISIFYQCYFVIMFKCWMKWSRERNIAICNLFLSYFYKLFI